MPGMTPIASYFTSPVDLVAGCRIFSRQEVIPAPFCLSLVNLPELDNEVEQTVSQDIEVPFLSDEEKEIFLEYSYAKRKREWLGGRLAAKHAVLSLSDSQRQAENFPMTSILPNKNGSPGVYSSTLSVKTLPALSISHSHDYAVALATTSVSCGVDIQKISDKTEKVADRFCDIDEETLLAKHAPQLTTQERLTLLWSAKEALKKSLLQDQPTIFQGVSLQSISTEKYFILQLIFPEVLAHPVQVCALRLEDYMLAYTLGEYRDA